MHCTQCDTLTPPDAKFCAKCGSPVGETGRPTEEATAVPVVVSKPKAFWLFVVGVCLVGAYAAMFIPAFAGQNFQSKNLFSTMLWTGLFFYLWWKRRARKGWHGALIGSVIGILASFAAAFIGGFMRAMAQGSPY